MSTDAPQPARDADDSDTLAPTLARPAGSAPSFGSLDLMFAPTTHDGEVGTFARYRVLKKLGQGGMGAVYLGYDAALDRKVALKVMLPALAADPDSRERFLREARSAAKVKSDHTVVIYEVGQERGIPFIAMEYLLGMPLDQYLHTKGDVPLLHAMRVGREIALGLVAVHELGLVHRDIKPANVWLEAPKGRAKLLDFGLARSTDDTIQLTGTGMVVGTVAYMSPEQGRGEKVDHRSDLFSLGVMLYRLTTGKMPFNGTSAMALLTSLAIDTPAPPRQLNPNIPPKLDAVITRLLAKKPADRFQNALDAADALLDATRADPTAEHAPLVAVPLVVGAQTQSVWEGIEISESVAVPLADRDTAEDEDESSVAPRPARPKPSKLPLVAAVGALVLAVVAVGAVLAWPKKKPDVAQVDPGQTVPPERPQPKANADADRRGAGWVLSQGGFVTVAVKGERFDLRKGDLLPPAAFAIEGIDLAGIKTVSNDDLKQLPELKSLVELDLSGTGVTDAGLSHLGRCTNLRWLSLARTDIHDAGVAELKPCKNLVYLDLSFTPQKLTIEAFNAMSGCDKLEVFDLRGASIGVQGHGHINRTRPALNTNPHGQVINLVRALGGSVKYNEPGGPYGGADLTHVTLNTTDKPREQVAAVLVALARCRGVSELELTGPNVIDGDLLAFKRFRDLKRLDLSGTGAADAGALSFRNCTRLEALRLQNTKVADAALSEFVFGPLVLLDVRGTGTTAAKVAELQKALPKCKIEWEAADRKVAEWVISVGGMVRVNGAASFVTDAARLPKEAFRLTTVHLSDNPVTDADLVRLRDCPDVTGVYLINCPAVTDAGLAHLGRDTLTDLWLNWCSRVTDTGLAYFKGCKRLTSLGVFRCAVTDAGLAHFNGCTTLENLNVGYCPKVTDAGLANFRGSAAVEYLQLEGCAGVTDAGLANFKDSRGLLALTLSGCPKVTDAGLALFKECKGLKKVFLRNTAVTDASLAHLAGNTFEELDLRGTKVTAAKVAELRKTLPKCKIEWEVPEANDRANAEWVIAAGGSAYVNGGFTVIRNVAELPKEPFALTGFAFANADIDDAALARFKGSRGFKTLSLGATKVTDAGLAHFAGNKGLTHLWLGGTATSDAGLAHFAECKEFNTVDVEGTKVGDAGVAALKDCKKLLVLRLIGTQVSDDGLAALTGTDELRSLEVQKTKVTAQGAAEFAKRNPQCKIVHDGGTIEPTKK